MNQEDIALQRAISLVTLRAQTLGSVPGVPSPCISICRMSPRSGLCEGCFRTCDEIAAWSCASDQRKRDIWATIEQRMAAALA